MSTPVCPQAANKVNPGGAIAEEDTGHQSNVVLIEQGENGESLKYVILDSRPAKNKSRDENSPAFEMLKNADEIVSSQPPGT